MKVDSAKAGGAANPRPASSADHLLLAKVRELVKILSHENKQGGRDSAVIGGLSLYLANWKESVVSLAADTLAAGPSLRLVAPLDDYSTLSTEQRRRLLTVAIAGLSQLLDRTAQPGPQETPVPGPPTSPGRPGPSSRRASPEPAQRSPSGPGVSPAAASPPGTASSTSVLDSPLTTVRGVNVATASRLGKLGLKTVRDLLYFFPRRHNDFSAMKRIAGLVPGAEETVVATIWEVSTKRFGRSGRAGVEVIVGDESGTMRAVFFNQPYMARVLRPNTQVVLSGRVEVFRGQKVFESPQYENLESDDLVHTGRIVPVYPLTEGLYQRSVRRIIKSAIDHWASSLVDHLPSVVRKSARLIDLPYAISQVHYPDSHEMLAKAKERLAFDELFAIQLGALKVRRDWRESQPGNAMAVDSGLVHLFLNSLPFGLTAAQQRAMGEVLADQASAEVMTRLLQGEVGSGKTVVAAVALLVAVANGFQGVLMAPTEILAEQHYTTLTRLYDSFASALKSRDDPHPNPLPSGREREQAALSLIPLRSGRERELPSPSPTAVGEGRGDGSPGVVIGGGVPHRAPRLVLLTGSLRKREKDEVYASITAGEVDIVVGTHAIIQEEVELQRLGLCVVDEQHRFGVLQRSAVRQKGFNPDVLVMTATPIPRTLALTVYGDLDLSVIDELPPGRQEIRTRWLTAEDRERAYEFIRKQVGQGRQAFVICPLVAESDKIEAKAATAEYERLSKLVFPDLKLGLLHGRMKPAEKDSVMRRFGGGGLDILVCTTVVEVGIDVPNASVMLVEGADRFGLSQLHQLRGRVGRGAHQSYCILLADSPSAEARERLSVIERTQDGFALAEEDMKMRGPGEFLGTRQSGLPDMKIAKLSDVRLIELARQEALALFHDDPDLAKPENRLLVQHVAATWQRTSDLS